MSEVFWDEADGTRLYLLTPGPDLELQEQRARAHLAANPATGTAMYGVNADDPQTLAAVVAAGYEVAFTRVQLTLELDDPPLPELPAGIELRPASAADHRVLYDDIASVFGESRLGYIQDTCCAPIIGSCGSAAYGPRRCGRSRRIRPAAWRSTSRWATPLWCVSPVFARRFGCEGPDPTITGERPGRASSIVPLSTVPNRVFDARE